MLPVSGAEQLKTIGATPLRPISSQSIPYSQLVSPGPKLLVRQEEVPEPLALRALAQLDQDLAGRGRPARTSSSSASHRLALDGIHVLLHELADAVEELGDSVRRCEVHGRGAYRASGRPGMRARRPARSRAAAQPDHRGKHAAAAEPRRSAGGRAPGPPRSSTSRAVSAPDSGTSTSRGPAARKSGTSKPGRPAQDARHALLEQESLDQLGLGLVAPAGHAHELALGVARVDLARAPVRLAERRLERLAARAHQRHAAARAERSPRRRPPGRSRADERPSASTTSSSSSSTRPSAIRHTRTTARPRSDTIR